MAVFWRVWAISSGVILAVLVAFLALSTFQFSRAHSDLVGERLVVLADRIAAPFQAAAELGLPVSDVRNAAGLLARVRQSDERIVAIYVFGEGGEVVHSAGGTVADAAAVSELRRRGGGAAEWHGETGGGIAAGVEFAGGAAGGVAVVYPLSGSATRVWAMAAELSVAALGIFCLGGLISGLLLRLGLRGTIASFDRIDAQIAAFERDSWRGEEAAAAAAGLRAELDRAYTLYRGAVAGLRALGPDPKP